MKPVPPAHTEVGSAVNVGCAGAEFTVTANVCTVLLSQALIAFTVMFPLCALAPGVAEILLVVELPVQPEGNVHL
jgi:hypothetical protein